MTDNPLDDDSSEIVPVDGAANELAPDIINIPATQRPTIFWVASNNREYFILSEDLRHEVSRTAYAANDTITTLFRNIIATPDDLTITIKDIAPHGAAVNVQLRVSLAMDAEHIVAQFPEFTDGVLPLHQAITDKHQTSQIVHRLLTPTIANYKDRLIKLINEEKGNTMLTPEIMQDIVNLDANASIDDVIELTDSLAFLYNEDQELLKADLWAIIKGQSRIEFDLNVLILPTGLFENFEEFRRVVGDTGMRSYNMVAQRLVYGDAPIMLTLEDGVRAIENPEDLIKSPETLSAMLLGVKELKNHGYFAPDILENITTIDVWDPVRQQVVKMPYLVVSFDRGFGTTDESRYIMELNKALEGLANESQMSALLYDFADAMNTDRSNQIKAIEHLNERIIQPLIDKLQPEELIDFLDGDETVGVRGVIAEMDRNTPMPKPMQYRRGDMMVRRGIEAERRQIVHKKVMDEIAKRFPEAAEVLDFINSLGPDWGDKIVRTTETLRDYLNEEEDLSFEIQVETVSGEPMEYNESNISYDMLNDGKTLIVRVSDTEISSTTENIVLDSDVSQEMLSAQVSMHLIGNRLRFTARHILDRVNSILDAPTPEQ